MLGSVRFRDFALVTSGVCVVLDFVMIIFGGSFGTLSDERFVILDLGILTALDLVIREADCALS